MNKKIQELYKVPEEWFSYQTWKVDEALLSLSCIDHRFSEVKFCSLSTETPAKVFKFIPLMNEKDLEKHFHSYWMHDYKFNRDFLADENKELKRILAIHKKYLQTGKFPTGYIPLGIQEVLNNYKVGRQYMKEGIRCQEFLNTLYNNWMRRTESDEVYKVELEKRYPVEKFLKWVIKIKKANSIPWWTDSLTSEYIGKEEVVQSGETSLDEVDDPVRTWDRILRRVNHELEELGKERIGKRILPKHCYNKSKGEKAQKRKLEVYSEPGGIVCATLENIKAFAKTFVKNAQ